MKKLLRSACSFTMSLVFAWPALAAPHESQRGTWRSPVETFGFTGAASLGRRERCAPRARCVLSRVQF